MIFSHDTYFLTHAESLDEGYERKEHSLETLLEILPPTSYHEYIPTRVPVVQGDPGGLENILEEDDLRAKGLDRLP